MKAVRSSLVEDWDHYKKMRNIVNKNVKDDRKKHLAQVYENIMSKNDAKGLCSEWPRIWQVGNKVAHQRDFC